MEAEDAACSRGLDRFDLAVQTERRQKEQTNQVKVCRDVLIALALMERGAGQRALTSPGIAWTTTARRIPATALITVNDPRSSGRERDGRRRNLGGCECVVKGRPRRLPGLVVFVRCGGHRCGFNGSACKRPRAHVTGSPSRPKGPNAANLDGSFH